MISQAFYCESYHSARANRH